MENLYETPALHIVGDFNQVTAWYGWNSNDGYGSAII